MKKYLLSLIAIILAIGFSAFSTIHKKAKLETTTFLLFETPSLVNEALIQTPELWICVGEIGPLGASCPDVNPYAACELVVDEADTFVDVTDGDKIKINPLVTIKAAYNGCAGYLVVGYNELAQSERAEIHNMSEP